MTANKYPDKDDQNLDYKPGFIFTVLVILPFMVAVDVAEWVKNLHRRICKRKVPPGN